jgi:hypothetical protein
MDRRHQRHQARFAGVRPDDQRPGLGDAAARRGQAGIGVLEEFLLPALDRPIVRFQAAIPAAISTAACASPCSSERTPFAAHSSRSFCGQLSRRHPDDFAVPESHLFAEEFDPRRRACWPACGAVRGDKSLHIGRQRRRALGAARRRCRILSRALIAAPATAAALPQESRQMLALQAVAAFLEGVVEVEHAAAVGRHEGLRRRFP